MLPAIKREKEEQRRRQGKTGMEFCQCKLTCGVVFLGKGDIITWALKQVIHSTVYGMSIRMNGNVFNLMWVSTAADFERLCESKSN
jgi:hypothetical protein